MGKNNITSDKQSSGIGFVKGIIFTLLGFFLIGVIASALTFVSDNIMLIPQVNTTSGFFADGTKVTKGFTVTVCGDDSCDYVTDGTNDDVQIKQAIAYINTTYGRGTVKIVGGSQTIYQINTSIIVGQEKENTRLNENVIEFTMEDGTWLNMTANVSTFTVKPWANFGNIYVRTDGVKNWSKSVFDIDLAQSVTPTDYGWWGYPNIESIKAVGNRGDRNGYVLHYYIENGEYGYQTFTNIGFIWSQGFEKVIFIDFPDNCDTNCWQNSLHIGTVMGESVDYIYHSKGNATFTNIGYANSIDWIVYQDGAGNTSTHGIIDCDNSTSRTARFKGMFWDTEADEQVFALDSGVQSIVAEISGGGNATNPCVNGCGTNTITRTTYGRPTETFGTKDWEVEVSSLELTNTNAQLIVPSKSSATAPTFAFGDGDSGFYEQSDDSLRAAFGGAVKWSWDAARLTAGSAGGILNEVPTATNPVIVPFYTDTNTGIGWVGTGMLSFVTSGIKKVTIDTKRVNITGSLVMNGTEGFTGTCADGTSLTVKGGIITACS